MRWIRKTTATITQNANVRNLAGQISQLKSREPLIVHGTSIRNIHCSGVRSLPHDIDRANGSRVLADRGASVGDRFFINDV
jgi:hypothetical protein